MRWNILKKAFKFGCLGIIALIVIGIIIGIAGGGDDNDTTPATDGGTKQEEAKKTFSVGQDVTVGEFTFNVIGVNETNKLTSVLGDKTTSGKFAIVEVSVKNNDNKARIVDGEMFRVKAGGNEYEANVEYDVYVNEGGIGFFLQEINPGISKTGKMVFEIPADVASYDLQVSSGLGWSGGEYETIKLK